VSCSSLFREPFLHLLIHRNQIAAASPSGDIGTVVMGNVIQAGNKMNPARQATIYGGIPVDLPAMTVSRVCGSGAQAIANAEQEPVLALIDSAVAGGMENMNRAPERRADLGTDALLSRLIRLRPQNTLGINCIRVTADPSI
jgi:acetyl-CoA acetyltransferase